MQHINYVAMPGPGDIVPPDTSVEDFAIERMTETILDEWLADSRFYLDFAAGFSTATWESFERAVASCSDTEACAIYRAALREQMRESAKKASRQRIKQMRDDAAEDRAMAREGWDG